MQYKSLHFKNCFTTCLHDGYFTIQYKCNNLYKNVQVSHSFRNKGSKGYYFTNINAVTLLVLKVTNLQQQKNISLLIFVYQAAFHEISCLCHYPWRKHQFHNGKAIQQTCNHQIVYISNTNVDFHSIIHTPLAPLDHSRNRYCIYALPK